MASQKCFTIGIGGGSGAGKSTLAEQLVKALGHSAYHLCTDRYLLDWHDLPQVSDGSRNMETPTAYAVDELIRQIKDIQQGEPTYLPIYDWQQHQRSPMSEGVAEIQVLIVEGIIALTDTTLRACFDLKLAVETDARIRMVRRIEHDLTVRQLEIDQIKTRLLGTVIPQDRDLILPANQYADLRVDGTRDFTPVITQINNHLAAYFGV